MSLERRQFPRLQLSEDAIAVDANGRELGKVVLAGGGGMQITGGSAAVAASVKVGDQIRVTIMEPKAQTSNTIDVIVRHVAGPVLGVEFVTGEPSN
ncbi:MAG: PilZ domain-containing protein [Acidobacteriales bacterium]|nr:PilZ domain-containing protein [Terriglobales bacterium]